MPLDTNDDIVQYIEDKATANKRVSRSTSTVSSSSSSTGSSSSSSSSRSASSSSSSHKCSDDSDIIENTPPQPFSKTDQVSNYVFLFRMYFIILVVIMYLFSLLR